MDERYQPRTDWRNVGVFAGWLGTKWFDCGIKTPWGNLIVKAWRNRLFSERYGHTPVVKVGPLCVSWVRLKQFRARVP